jgi:RNA methyltransferase, TrmH family
MVYDSGMKITSHANPIIKDLLKLYKRSFRERSNLFVLEGRREFERLDPSFTIKKVFTTESLEHEACVYYVTEDIFEKISMRGQKGGVVAVIEQKHHCCDSFFEAVGDKPTLLVLEGIQKPGNVGAILRSASAFGIDGVILADCPIDLYNPNLLRAAISCVQSIPILESSTKNIIPELNKRGVAIYTSTLDESECLRRTKFENSLALVLGSEDKGASKEFIEAAQKKIKIPMNPGAVDSLNVSVAAALFCYEIDRQRTNSV